MKIVYETSRMPLPEQIIELYNNAGLNRPTGDKERIQKMLENATLIVSAWDGEQLVGVARSLTDWVYCCYLSDLAVRKDYQKSGVGRKLIELTKEKVGEQSMVLLLSVPTAVDYYPKVGFTKHERSFFIDRTK